MNVPGKESRYQPPCFHSGSFPRGKLKKSKKNYNLEQVKQSCSSWRIPLPPEICKLFLAIQLRGLWVKSVGREPDSDPGSGS